MTTLGEVAIEAEEISAETAQFDPTNFFPRSLNGKMYEMR